MATPLTEYPRDVSVAVPVPNDDRVSCVSCHFRYPRIRGFCPICGEPAPVAELIPISRGADEGNEIQPDSDTPPWRRLVKSVRRGFFLVVLVVVVLAGGWFFFLVRNHPVPDKVVSPPPLVDRSLQSPSPEATAPENGPLRPAPNNKSVRSAVSRAAKPAPATDDPAELWKRVRKGDADAEVALAKLYVDGNGVPRNCEQAHLLLLAASRKGHKTADSVLSGLYTQRCQ